MAEETTQNAPWHDTFSPEDKGFLQIKGWDKLADPGAALTAALGSYRAAEQKLGVPPDRLVRWPEATDADGLKAIHARLGVPADATGYDLSGVKFADGTPIEKDFDTFMRDTALKHNLPKDVAAGIAAAVLGFGEAAEASERAQNTVTRQAEDIKLRADWGGNYDVFKATIDRFLASSPFTPEQKDAFMSTAQGQKILYAVASSDREAQLHGGQPQQTGGRPNMSRDEAAQTLEMKKSDPVWLKSYMAGEVAAVADFQNLTRLMVGAPPQR
jgi:hypothetical protein